MAGRQKAVEVTLPLSELTRAGRWDCDFSAPFQEHTSHHAALKGLWQWTSNDELPSPPRGSGNVGRGFPGAGKQRQPQATGRYPFGAGKPGLAGHQRLSLGGCFGNGAASACPSPRNAPGDSQQSAGSISHTTLGQGPREEVPNAQRIGPGVEVLPIEMVALHGQDRQDVPPLLVGDLATLAEPVELREDEIGRAHV